MTGCSVRNYGIKEESYRSKKKQFLRTKNDVQSVTDGVFGCQN